MATPAMLRWTESQWKNAFRRNRVYIIRNMGMTGLLDFMVENNMIGTCAYEEHLSVQNEPESRRVDKMVSYLNRRPAKDFVKLMRYFEESQQHHIIERLAQGTEASNPEVASNPTWTEWQRQRNDSQVPLFQSERAAARRNMESIQIQNQNGVETVYVPPQVAEAFRHLQQKPKEMAFSSKIMDLTDEKALEYTSTCNLCLDNKPNILLLPCGHCCFCKTCFIKYITNSGEWIFTLHNLKCIMCRTSIEKAHPVFM